MVRLGIWSGTTAHNPTSSSKIKTPKSTKVDSEPLDKFESLSTSSHSTDSLAAAEPTDVTTDEASEIATGSGTQSMTQEEDWEDLADTKMTPNSSIHILAKSSENIHPNAGHDWVDLKERLEESGNKGQQSAEADKVQHEVAALKMAQGLLKGELDNTKANAATLTAQLQLEAADKQQLSSKLAESESIKSQLEAKIAALMKDKAALEEKVTQAAAAPDKYQQVETLPKYCCKGCGLDLAAAKAVMWSECKMGRNNESGMLFGATVNAERMGKVSVTHLATGDYEVQDVKCAKCSAHLGWTYLKAFNEKNKFKEGSTILYKRLLTNVSK